MGITQNTGASSLIKPGVIDNTAARPASPYEGQVIFQKDTDQLLVWNGTTWVIPNSPAQNPQGLELIKTQSFSAVTPYLDMTSIFSDDYVSYKIMINGYGTAFTTLSMQFLSGTNTPLTSGDYYRYGIRATGGGSFVSLNSFGTGNGQIGVIANNSTQKTLIEMTIGNTRNTSSRKYIYCQSFDPANGDALWMQFQVVSTLLFTGLRFTPDSGSFTGEIQIYGYRK